MRASVVAGPGGFGCPGFSSAGRAERSLVMTPRFSFPEPARQGVGERLFANADKVAIELFRFNGHIVAQVDLRASFGRDPFGDEEPVDAEQLEAENADTLATVRNILGEFAAAKGGA
jgi:hypothetical protein